MGLGVLKAVAQAYGVRGSESCCCFCVVFVAVLLNLFANTVFFLCGGGVVVVGGGVVGVEVCRIGGVGGVCESVLLLGRLLLSCQEPWQELGCLGWAGVASDRRLGWHLWPAAGRSFEESKRRAGRWPQEEAGCACSCIGESKRNPCTSSLRGGRSNLFDLARLSTDKSNCEHNHNTWLWFSSSVDDEVVVLLVKPQCGSARGSVLA